MSSKTSPSIAKKHTLLLISGMFLLLLLGATSCDTLFPKNACIDVRRESTVLTIAVNGTGSRVECITNDGQTFIVDGEGGENCPLTISFQGTAQITVIDGLNSTTFDTIIEAGGRQGLIYSTLETRAQRCECAG